MHWNKKFCNDICEIPTTRKRDLITYYQQRWRNQIRRVPDDKATWSDQSIQRGRRRVVSSTPACPQWRSDCSTWPHTDVMCWLSESRLLPLCGPRSVAAVHAVSCQGTGQVTSRGHCYWHDVRVHVKSVTWPLDARDRFFVADISPIANAHAATNEDEYSTSQCRAMSQPTKQRFTYIPRLVKSCYTTPPPRAAPATGQTVIPLESW